MSIPDRPFRRMAVRLASALAWMLMLYVWVPYRVRLMTFLTASRLCACVPGALGILLRRHWYRRTLAACGGDLVVDWLGVFKTPEARVGRKVFVGSLCWIAEVDIRDNVMIAARTAVQGGGQTHRFDRLDVPMTDQPGALRVVTIGPDAWIGTGATVLADVSPGTIVGAGAVVTRTFAPNMILAGVPARPIRSRSGETQSPGGAHG